MYSQTVLDHFRSPRNAGELPGADGIGRSGAPEIGPMMVIAVKLVGERVAQARFQSYGCGASIAAGSVLTELVMGKTIAQCLALTPAELEAALGGLPAHKQHCAQLAVEALQAALRPEGG